MSKKYLGLTGLTKVFTLIKGLFDGLATVAKTGSYNDLTDKPSVPGGENYVLKAGDTMSGTLNMNTTNGVAMDFRPNNGNYHTTISYQTAGNEACVFATKNAVTSLIFINGEDSSTYHSDTRWQSLTPALQIKNNCVSIGSLVANGITPSWLLSVNGAKASIFYNTASDTPIFVQGNASGAFIGFKKNDGTVWGYIGVKSDKKPYFYDSAAREIITSATIGSQSVNYATSAGTANLIPYTHTNEINFKGGKQTTVYFNYRDADTDAPGSQSTDVTYKFCNYSSVTTHSTVVANKFTGDLNGNANSANHASYVYANSFTICTYEGNHGRLNSKSGHHLLAQDDKNLVWYSSTNSVIWQSGTSSRRFKHNIHDMTEERAKKILHIRPVTFDWNDGLPISTRKCDNAGVIAEEVSQVCPDLVVYDNYDNDPSTKIEHRVEYERFTPYLIKMVQMQQKQIDALTKRVEELEAKV